jgi:fructose-1-phosphate kinase PfkB-like protein
VILCVAANPSIDRLFEVERLVPGTIHRPADFVQVAGGKGLNVARAAARLGGRVRAAALLGGHAGRWIAEQLEAEGVELSAAWAAAETRSSLSVAGAIEGGLTEFYEHGFPVERDEWSAFADLLLQLAPAAGWTTVSGSLPSGAPADGYLAVIRSANVVLDSREAGVEARPAVVKVNAEEAEELTGTAVTGLEDAERAARTLHEATGGAAIGRKR